MRLARTAVAIIALLFSAFALAPVVRADSTDDDIKAMKELEAAGKDDECVAKMDLVRAGRDKRAYAALQELTGSKSDKVACGAIRSLTVGWRDADTFRWLVGKIGDKTLYDVKAGRPEVYKCVLASIREFPPERVKQALKPLADAVARFMTTNAEFTDLAIRAYGTVPDRFTVQQLLQWLDQAAAPATGDAKAIKEQAKSSLLQTLAALCSHEEADAAAWKKWWDENGKTFRFPDTAKPGEKDPPSGTAKPAAGGADPSGLSEFKDETYGWSVKRPEAEWWKFMKPDYNGPRVALRCGGGDSAETARAYFGVHDPTSSEPRDVASFATWVIEHTLKQEMPVDGIIQKPATKTVKAGNVEWTVVTARGLAGGVKSNWGSMERRFYITKLGTKILYVDAFATLSADNEDKTALWACIEAITITAK
jgi:hypothetical protein